MLSLRAVTLGAVAIAVVLPVPAASAAAPQLLFTDTAQVRIAQAVPQFCATRSVIGVGVDRRAYTAPLGRLHQRPDRRPGGK